MASSVRRFSVKPSACMRKIAPISDTGIATSGTRTERNEPRKRKITNTTMASVSTSVDPTSVICYFRDYNNSSLDIWIVFVVKDPDFHKHMALRQRLNLAFMRTVESRGLSFAFPTQTVHVASLPPGGRAEG